MIAALELDPSAVTILRAACLDGPAALAAVEELRRSVDIDALDWGRQRLLPLLHRNLLRLGVDDWHATRMRGVRRYFWARSEMRLRALAPVLTALRDAGLRTAVLKGAGLVAAGLEELSARPMDDLDLLVRPADLAAAVDIVARLGFRPMRADRAEVLGPIARRLPGWPFADAAGNELDLHWHVLHADCRPRADDSFWEGARPATLAGAPTATLDVADQLLQAIAHAARWNETSTPRWASDAVTILRSGGVDWNRLEAAARRHRLVPALHDGLALLQRHLEADVPAPVMRRLGRVPRPVARFEHDLASTGSTALFGWRGDALALFERRRTSATLWRLPLVATAWAAARAQDDLPRAATLFAFRATGERRRLRRILRIDRWARPAPDGLPELVLPSEADERCFLDGWHAAEEAWRWSSGREARLGWRLPPGMAEPIACDLRIGLLAPLHLPPVKLRIFANDHLVVSWRSRPPAQFEPERRFVIPALAVRRRRTLVLTFAVDDVRTPAMIGLSRDRRRLGVLIGRMTLGAVLQGEGSRPI